MECVSCPNISSVVGSIRQISAGITRFQVTVRIWTLIHGIHSSTLFEYQDHSSTLFEYQDHLLSWCNYIFLIDLWGLLYIVCLVISDQYLHWCFWNAHQRVYQGIQKKSWNLLVLSVSFHLLCAGISQLIRQLVQLTIQFVGLVELLFLLKFICQAGQSFGAASFIFCWILQARDLIYCIFFLYHFHIFLYNAPIQFLKS